MKRFFVPALAVLTVLSCVNTTLADGETPPLRVTATGYDASNCQAVAAPCRTIKYALTQVGKHGRIRVGNGSFELADVADIVYVLSGAIDVRGIRTAGSRSTLIGVAPEFATALEAKGFRVIVDTKSLQRDAVDTQLSLLSNSPATACSGGFAGSFPCSNVDLLAHIADRTPAAQAADIWGFMDLNTHREYAIVSYSTGTAVYDVTAAATPREVGFVDGQSTAWRDIKVYQFWNATDSRWNAYAYITADNASDGFFIIDLSELPQRIARINYASDFGAAHNVYLMDTDFGTGISITGNTPTAILAGSNFGDGRYRTYGLANPASPVFIASPQTPSDQPVGNRMYMHDAASMVVTDSRKDTQCSNASADNHCDVLFDFNESSVDIWDASDPLNLTRLSRFTYGNSSYTHSGWPSEDQQFLFVQDELDERNRGLATTLRVVSIANLTTPMLVGAWTGPSNAIDHNGFVRGNRYYMSNYTRGLTILDISDPANPVSAGRFDTYPVSDSTGFPGNWGAYPFLPSGNIALSDIDSGFYMVADKTLNVAEGTFSFASEAFGGDETQTLAISVQRTGGSQGAASVNWEIIGATATFDDLVATRGVLNWADGDGSARTINLGLTNDGIIEGLERALIKLSAPDGGATLSSPSIASVYISDPGDMAVVEFSSATLSVAERGFGMAVAVLRRSGSANGALSVDVTAVDGDASNGTDYSGPATATVSWADGDANPKWIEYAITDDGNGEADEFFTLNLSGANGATLGTNATLRVDILDGNGFNSAPSSVAGANQVVSSGASVTLNGSSSSDPDGDALSFSWAQTRGPSVNLSGADTATASFNAPTVGSNTELRFALQVTDTGGLVDTSTVVVTVRTSFGTTTSSSSGGGAFGLWMLLGLLGLALVSRRGAS